MGLQIKKAKREKIFVKVALMAPSGMAEKHILR